MKIGIIGAGATGGFFAARLALAGHDVSMLTFGATLEALNARGLRLDSGGRCHTVVVCASDRAEALGPQDLLVLAGTAPELADMIPAMVAMRSAHTVVLSALHGLPWWYFLCAGVPLTGQRLLSVDADGALERNIPLQDVLGCVVYPACSTPAPGHVIHDGGNRLVLGEPAGGSSERARRVAATLAQAGFDAEESADIRCEIWVKLLGNACFNPVSLITRSHTDVLIDDDAVRDLFVTIMNETLTVGRAVGLEIAVVPASRIAVARKLGHVRTSMLQDAIAGQPVELDAILGALLEVAQAAAVPVPMLSAVHAIARTHAREAGLLRQRGN